MGNIKEYDKISIEIPNEPLSNAIYVRNEAPQYKTPAIIPYNHIKDGKQKPFLSVKTKTIIENKLISDVKRKPPTICFELYFLINTPSASPAKVIAKINSTDILTPVSFKF